MTPMKRAAAGCLVALAAAGQIAAHDFWLIPDAFRLAPGDRLSVRGQTSSAFPSSLSALTVDRIEQALVVDARGRVTPSDVAPAGTSLFLRHRPQRAGQYIIAMTIHPRAVRESPGSFREYLVIEGAPEILERLEQENGFPTDSITRRYAKYAKTIVEVGEGGPRAFALVVGHPLEFVPLIDPASVQPGDTIAFQLLLEGRPLPHVRVHAGSVVRAAGTTLDALAGTEQHRELQTDDNGVIRIAVDRAGIWNLRALYLLPSAPNTGADWETHWVSFVFAAE